MNPYGNQTAPGGPRPPGQGPGPPQMQHYQQYPNQGFPQQGMPQYPGAPYPPPGRAPFPMGRPISLPRPPGQMMYPQRPPSFRPPGFPLPGPPGAPPMAPLPKPSTTVYVGKIASTVDEVFMKTILEVCGPLKGWKRAADPTSGKLKGFGFAEYESAEGALRAMRLLKDLSLDGQELLINVNEATRLYLDHFKANKKAEKSKQDGEPDVVIQDEADEDGEKESKASEKTGEAKADTEDGKKMETEGEDGEDDEDREAREKLEEMVNERAKTMPPPPSPSIADFIAKARDAAEEADKDGGSRRGDSEGPSTSDKDRPYSSHEHRSSRFRTRDPEDEMMRERERERERSRRERERERERSERDADRAAETREKELEVWEKERERERRREKEREKEAEKDRRAQVKEDEGDLESDDATRKRRARETGDEKRKRLQREREEDELDRLLEDKEVREFKRLRAIEEIERSTLREDQPEPEAGTGNPAESPRAAYRDANQAVSEPRAVQNGFPRLLSEPPEETGPGRGASPAARKPPVAIPGKKRPAAPFVFEEEEQKETGARSLVPIEYTPEELAAAKAAAAVKAEEKRVSLAERVSPAPAVRQPSPMLPVPPAMPANLAAAAEFAKSLGKGGEEKRKEGTPRRDESLRDGREKRAPVKQLDTKQLIDSIPKTKAELFAHPVDWAVFDSEKIHQKMRPWIGKKIAEFLGEEESTLVDFILQSMLKHDSAEKMLELLEPLLDEEAELFVLKMWRMLIFELKRAEQDMVR